MAFITLTGNLLDPGGFLAIGDQVRFTHKSSTGSTIKSAVNVITIPNSGNYSITLQYGLVKVDYKDSSSNTFTNLGVVTVNPDNLSTTLPELLNAVVPPSSQEMIEFQTILAECKAAENNAEQAVTDIDALTGQQTTLGLINSAVAYTVDKVLETSGFTTSGDGGSGKWKQNGVTGQTPSQTPAQIGDALLNDASGNQWSMILSNDFEFETFAELEASTTGNIGQKLICRERDNAQYIVRPSSYSKQGGDATLAGGLDAEIQIYPGISVNSFGADSSGATASDSAATDMLSRTSDFIMGAGLYKYNSASTFNISGINGLSIKGAGKFLTRALFDYSTGDCIYLSGCSNFIVSDMTIDVPSVTTRTSGNGLHAIDSQFGNIDNILFSRFKDGLRISSTNKNNSNTIYHTKLDFRNGEAGGSSIVLDGCVDVFFNQITSNNPEGQENENGVLILECLAAWFTDMDILKSNVGLNIKATQADTLTTWLFFKGCAFDKNTGSGTNIETTNATAKILGVFFTQCWSSSNGVHGVSISSSGPAEQIDGVDISGHIIVNNQQHGIKIGNSKNVHIGAKTHIAGNSQQTANTYRGVSVDANVSDWSVTDSTIGSGFRYPASQQFGVIVAAGTSDRYQVSLNRLSNNVTGGFLDLANGSDIYTQGNIG